MNKVADFHNNGECVCVFEPLGLFKNHNSSSVVRYYSLGWQ